MTIKNDQSSHLTNEYCDVSPNRDGSLLKRVIFEGVSKHKPTNHYVTVQYSSFFHGGPNDGVSYKHTNDVLELQLDSDKPPARNELLKIVVPTMNLWEICEVIVAPDCFHENSPTLKFKIELINAFPMNNRILSYLVLRLNRAPVRRRIDVGFETVIEFRQFTANEVKPPKRLNYIVGLSAPSVLPKIVECVLPYMDEGSTYVIRPGGQINDQTSENICGALYEVKILECRFYYEPIYSLCNFEMEMLEINRIKQKADEHLKSEKFSLACNMYQKLCEELERLKRSRSCKDLYQTTTINILKNLSLAKLKMKAFDDCIDICKFLLERDADDIKTLFRMGNALEIKSKFKEAATCFETILKLDPDNQLALNRFNECVSLDESSEKMEEKVFRLSFDRLKHVGLEGDTEY